MEQTARRNQEIGEQEKIKMPCAHRLTGEDGDECSGVRVLFRIKEARDERQREHRRVLETIVLPRQGADLLQHARAAPVARQEQLPNEVRMHQGVGVGGSMGETVREAFEEREREGKCKKTCRLRCGHA